VIKNAETENGIEGAESFRIDIANIALAKLDPFADGKGIYGEFRLAQVRFAAFDGNDRCSVQGELDGELGLETAEVEDPQLVERFADGVGNDLHHTPKPRIGDICAESVDSRRERDVVGRPGAVLVRKRLQLSSEFAPHRFVCVADAAGHSGHCPRRDRDGIMRIDRLQLLHLHFLERRTMKEGRGGIEITISAHLDLGRVKPVVE
jgi:hypothetical protein